ncbi:MAG: DUF1700 domain-containing protein, partial [Clostridia bacterium]|nr:DUF1700 domain-containing protein [Clostridia bacterium]
YNEWRDELKDNLLCVSESERRRVLDYYAEAYADRRDAGFSEREIIDDFGAPYDAAQRILSESDYEAPPSREPTREEKRREERERREERREEKREEKREYGSNSLYGNYNGPTPQFAQASKPVKQRGDYTWVFVLLCIIFAFPIFMVVMAMVGVTVTFCVAPFGVLIGGVATIGAGVGALLVDATYGVITIGTGLIIFGLSLIIMPLCFQLVKWMWKLFHMFFAWLKRLFSGKEKA